MYLKKLRMFNSTLYTKYQNVCNKYLQTFCKKHNFDYTDTHWISDRVGTIVMIGDYFVSMDTIVIDIEQNVPEHVFLQYYNWVIENEKNINYDLWLRYNTGETPISNSKIEEAIHHFTQAIEDFDIDDFENYIENKNK